MERERASSQARLREASERYEQQLQTQRMRLVADADMRMEQLEMSRCAGGQGGGKGEAGLERCWRSATA